LCNLESPLGAASDSISFKLRACLESILSAPNTVAYLWTMLPIVQACYNSNSAVLFHMKILVIKLSSIGDVVHTLPAVAVLRRVSPCAWISWVVDVRASAILKDCPAIDELIEIDTRSWKSAGKRQAIVDALTGLRQLNGTRGGSWSSSPEFHAETESTGRPDIAVDFQGLLKSGAIALLSGARRRIGLETSDLREKASRYFLTEQARTATSVHVIDKNMQLVKASLARTPDDSNANRQVDGNGDTQYHFPINTSSDDEAFVNRIVADTARLAIINPGGGWVTKLWEPLQYAEIADWLWSEHEMKSLVTYGPGEEGLAQQVVAASRSGRSRTIGTTLKQFVALARRAILFVGGDTGPLHLAAASGTPIVGLYGPTSPERNGPWNHHDITVGRDLWCRMGCHRRTCWHWGCMQIPTSEVKRAITLRLSAANLGSGSHSEGSEFLV
jgi:ADP-heptose:LPS heptosyltransferase